MQPDIVERGQPICGEALTDAGRLVVAEVTAASYPTRDWWSVWSKMEKALGVWSGLRPASDLVKFDRIADQLNESKEELDALVFGLLLGTFIEDHDVPAVDSKIQALVYLGSPDLLHQAEAVDWLRAHRPATVNRLRALLEEAVACRTTRAAPRLARS